MAKNGLLRLFLFSVLFVVLFDVFHLLFHLSHDPALWKLHGVSSKLMSKLIPLPLWAVDPERCRQARELLDQAGTAREAHETLFGHVKKKPPYGTFPADIDQVSWWGEFKPFELWHSPEFEAAWINPQGQEVARQRFRGSRCRLAKTSLKAENQPRGMFEGGMWNVIVTCEDYLIDKQTFAVLPQGGRGAGPDSLNPPPEAAMIWAEDAVK